jgi:hypothetical protein
MAAVEASAADDVARRIKALAAEMRERDFLADTMRAGGRLCVHVAHRRAAELSDTIYAAPAEDGAWWFWWSAGHRIALVGDVEAAAFKIAYVLTPIRGEITAPLWNTQGTASLGQQGRIKQ